jgi:serine/threonine protein kinase
LRERVAIKTIRPDLAQRPQVIDRFRREVKQARTISHPNVCRIHELFCDVSQSEAKVWFLSMEFLDGSTLSEHIHHIGPVKPALAFDLLEQIVSGLKALHANGIIHRDLKAGNIMLVSGTLGRLRAVITDFGLATNVLRPDGGLVEHGGQGTPEYMAPEQRTSADVTALADQYALGVILCEMLTGSRPTRKEVTSGRAQFESKLARSISPQWARQTSAASHAPLDRGGRCNRAPDRSSPLVALQASSFLHVAGRASARQSHRGREPGLPRRRHHRSLDG